MGRCVFCGATGRLTGEHIWAVWQKQYIPRDIPHHQAGSVTHEKGKPARQNSKKIDGDPRSRRIRCVCANCNSGWMSRLQERAKPIVVPMLNGATQTLSTREQEIVASWVAMAVMCAEHADKTRIAIPQGDRDSLYTVGVGLSDQRIPHQPALVERDDRRN